MKDCVFMCGIKGSVVPEWELGGGNGDRMGGHAGEE